MNLANKIISGILIIVAVLFWVGADTFPAGNGQGPGADFMPKVGAALLIFLSILLFLKKEKTEEEVFTLSKDTVKVFILGVITLIAYVVLIQLIGFSVSTVLFALSWMLLMGIRNWKTLVFSSVLISILVTYVFETLLNVPIPHGFLY